MRMLHTVSKKKWNSIDSKYYKCIENIPMIEFSSTESNCEKSERIG